MTSPPNNICFYSLVKTEPDPSLLCKYIKINSVNPFIHSILLDQDWPDQVHEDSLKIQRPVKAAKVVFQKSTLATQSSLVTIALFSTVQGKYSALPALSVLKWI